MWCSWQTVKGFLKGLKGECLGDIDLWSHEGPPTLGDKLQELEHHKRIISEGIEFLEDSDDLDLVPETQTDSQNVKSENQRYQRGPPETNLQIKLSQWNQFRP